MSKYHNPIRQNQYHHHRLHQLYNNNKTKSWWSLSLFKVIIYIVITSWVLILLYTYHHYYDNNGGGVYNYNNHIHQKMIKVKSFYGNYNNNDNNNDQRTDNNQEKEDESSSPYYSLTMYGKHRYQQSFDSLPKWLHTYFQWYKKVQQQQQQNKNEQNIPKKYAVLLCLPNDTLCGGLSDRLRPLPFYLLIAKYSNRLLCIHWEKPFGLHEYLQPILPMGIDWRCPLNEVKKIYDVNYTFDHQPNVKLFTFGSCFKKSIPFHKCIEKDLEYLQNNDDTFVTIDLFSHSSDTINHANLLAQSHSYFKGDGGGVNDDGADNENKKEQNFMPLISRWQYPEMIADIFRVMFEPVPILAKRINMTMSQLGLVENQYISVHVRARYPAGLIMKYFNPHGGRNQTFDKDGGLRFEGPLKDWIGRIVDNAIRCGSLLAPDLNKIFFVSDHSEAMEYALSHDVAVGNKNGDNSNEKIVRAIGPIRDHEPLHMDGNNHKNINAADFYSVFEDLLIMGGSRCVSHGIGSFGSFGAGLAGNRCRAEHRKFNAEPEKCPNDRAERKLIPVSSSDMLFGGAPGGVGKLNDNE